MTRRSSRLHLLQKPPLCVCDQYAAAAPLSIRGRTCSAAATHRRRSATGSPSAFRSRSKVLEFQFLRGHLGLDVSLGQLQDHARRGRAAVLRYSTGAMQQPFFVLVHPAALQHAAGVAPSALMAQHQQSWLVGRAVCGAHLPPNPPPRATQPSSSGADETARAGASKLMAAVKSAMARAADERQVAQVLNGLAGVLREQAYTALIVEAGECGARRCAAGVEGWGGIPQDLAESGLRCALPVALQSRKFDPAAHACGSGAAGSSTAPANGVCACMAVPHSSACSSCKSCAARRQQQRVAACTSQHAHLITHCLPPPHARNSPDPRQARRAGQGARGV